MFRAFTIIFATFSLMLPAHAATTPAKHDLSNVRCEDPKVIAFIMQSIPGMKTASGRSILQVLGDNPSIAATTIYARPNGFACHISLNMQFGHGGQAVVGKFTYREFVNGRPTVEFLPGY